MQAFWWRGVFHAAIIPETYLFNLLQSANSPPVRFNLRNRQTPPVGCVPLRFPLLLHLPHAVFSNGARAGQVQGAAPIGLVDVVQRLHQAWRVAGSSSPRSSSVVRCCSLAGPSASSLQHRLPISSCVKFTQVVTSDYLGARSPSCPQHQPPLRPPAPPALSCPARSNCSSKKMPGKWA